jgi:uncharacterized protein (DUF4415 family)
VFWKSGVRSNHNVFKSVADTAAQGEQRLIIIGMDHLWQLLVVVYTERNNKIRLISTAQPLVQRNTAMKTEHDFSQGKRGAVAPKTGKNRITIYIDDDMLETFRQLGDAASKGYQATMNEALQQYLDKAKTPIALLEPKAINEETLRRIIQEELRAAK